MEVHLHALAEAIQVHTEVIQIVIILAAEADLMEMDTDE